jgi:hypothetical protein
MSAAVPLGDPDSLADEFAAYAMEQSHPLVRAWCGEALANNLREAALHSIKFLTDEEAAQRFADDMALPGVSVSSFQDRLLDIDGLRLIAGIHFRNLNREFPFVGIERASVASGGQRLRAHRAQARRRPRVLSAIQGSLRANLRRAPASAWRSPHRERGRSWPLLVTGIVVRGLCRGALVGRVRSVSQQHHRRARHLCGRGHPCQRGARSGARRCRAQAICGGSCATRTGSHHPRNHLGRKPAFPSDCRARRPCQCRRVLFCATLIGFRKSFPTSESVTNIAA